MAGKLQLINAALARLGEQHIVSLDENTTQQIVATAHYETALDAMLREHPWNFATADIELPRIVGPKPFKFEYAYQLPTDLLRLLEVYDDRYFKVQGRAVLTDSKFCRIKYIKRLEDPSTWDASFTSAFTYRLAADICYAITDSASLSEQLNILAAQKLRTAKAIDAQEDVLDGMDGSYSSILNARF